MSVATKNSSPEQVFNVPNQITAMRLVLSIVLFVLIPLEYYLIGMVVFVIAAATDWVDGFYARRYGQVTTLGRILDPFVDKIIICGSFIYLAAVGPSASGPGSGIAAWMAVVVVGRELLVTALRHVSGGGRGEFFGRDVWQAENGLPMHRRCHQPVCAGLRHSAPPRVARLAVAGERLVGRGPDDLFRIGIYSTGGSFDVAVSSLPEEFGGLRRRMDATTK